MMINFIYIHLSRQFQFFHSVWKSKEFCSGKCIGTLYLHVLIIGNYAMVKINGIIIKNVIHVVLLVDSLVSDKGLTAFLFRSPKNKHVSLIFKKKQ